MWRALVLLVTIASAGCVSPVGIRLWPRDPVVASADRSAPVTIRTVPAADTVLVDGRPCAVDGEGTCRADASYRVTSRYPRVRATAPRWAGLIGVAFGVGIAALGLGLESEIGKTPGTLVFAIGAASAFCDLIAVFEGQQQLVRELDVAARRDRVLTVASHQVNVVATWRDLTPMHATLDVPAATTLAIRRPATASFDEALLAWHASIGRALQGDEPYFVGAAYYRRAIGNHDDTSAARAIALLRDYLAASASEHAPEHATDAQRMIDELGALSAGS